MPKLTNWNPTQKSWFLGIGIDQYKNFEPLTNAVRGLNELKKVLTKDYDIDDDCIVTLTNKQATKENIIDTFDDLGNRINPGDKLLIYYSGHGHLNSKLDLGYWTPVDAKPKKASSFIPNSTVRDYIKSIKAKHILLISDSCFSGSFFMQGAFRSSRALNELDNLASRWAICSGRHDEKVYDGIPGENSPFTQSLLNFLRNNSSDCINISKLSDHVIEETAANYEQLPDGRPMFGVGHQGGQYIFWKKSVKKNAPVGEVSNKARLDQPLTSDFQTSIAQTNNKSFDKTKVIGIASILGIALLAFLLYPNSQDLDTTENQNQKTQISASAIQSPSSKSSSAKSGIITSVKDAKIILFESNDFGGREFPIYGDQFSTIDNFNKIEIEGLKFEDVISSAKVLIPADYEFVLYEKRRQKGEELIIYGNGKIIEYDNIGALADKVSSCELRKRTD